MVKHHIEHYRRTIVVSAMNLIHFIMVIKKQQYVFSLREVQDMLRWAIDKLAAEKRVVDDVTRLKMLQLLELQF